MEMVGETEIDRGTEWEALAVVPPRTNFRGFSSIVDGLGVTLASNPVNQRVVFEQPIHSQDHITRRIKIGDNKHNIGRLHGGEPNGEPGHFGDPDRGGPVYENDFSGGHRSFRKTEAGGKFGIDEAEFSAGV